jgi:hypothetical protein
MLNAILRLLGRPPRFDLDPRVKLADVRPFISDVAQAKLALAELRAMGWGVYMPTGWKTARQRRFNVNVRVVNPREEWSVITLEEWCKRWLAAHAVQSSEQITA